MRAAALAAACACALAACGDDDGWDRAADAAELRRITLRVHAALRRADVETACAHALPRLRPPRVYGANVDGDDPGAAPAPPSLEPQPCRRYMKRVSRIATTSLPEGAFRIFQTHVRSDRAAARVDTDLGSWRYVRRGGRWLLASIAAS